MFTRHRINPLTLFTIVIWIVVALIVGTSVVYAQADPDIEECPDGYQRNEEGVCVDGEGNPIQIEKDGIFDCSAGEYALGVAQLAANNIHVPVNDRAVTLNTGYLVYKECVLDVVNVAYREAATASLVGQMMRYFLEGDDGNPLYVQNLAQHRLEVRDRAAAELSKPYNWENINPAYRDGIRTAVVGNYYAERAAPIVPSCPLSPSEQQALIENQQFSMRGFLTIATNPGCQPLFATIIGQNNFASRVAAEEENEITRLGWSDGVKDAVRTDEVPTANGGTRIVRNVVTPGSLLQGLLQQYAGSGFRQLENATEVGELISALFSGFANRVVTNQGGFAGINDPIGDGLSFIEQLIQQATQRARQATTNTALQILTSALATETQFLALREESKTKLDEAVKELRDTEKQCWVDVEAAVRAAGWSGTAKTSTEFSDEAMQEKIKPLLDVVTEHVEAAEKAVEKLRSLIADVSGGSPTAQQLAITELDSLISEEKIHRPSDVEKAREQRDDIKNTVDSDVDGAIQGWKSGDGWCNVANAAVIERWKQEWQ